LIPHFAPSISFVSANQMQRRNNHQYGGRILLVGLLLILGLSRPPLPSKDGKLRSSEDAPHTYMHDGLPTAFPDNYYTPVTATCQPLRMHIAQRTNVKTVSTSSSTSKTTARNVRDKKEELPSESYTVDMTVSFTLAYDTCVDKEVLVSYGRGTTTEGVVVVPDPPLQFNYTSELSDGLYMSDWIYHVELPSLAAGLQQYWYTIEVWEESTPFTLTPLPETSEYLRQVSTERRQLACTEQTTFVTPPLPGKPTTLALIGDLGQKYIHHVSYLSSRHERILASRFEFAHCR
jgi:hypothetical protein